MYIFTYLLFHILPKLNVYVYRAKQVYYCCINHKRIDFRVINFYRVSKMIEIYGARFDTCLRSIV